MFRIEEAMIAREKREKREVGNAASEVNRMGSDRTFRFIWLKYTYWKELFGQVGIDLDFASKSYRPSWTKKKMKIAKTKM